MRYIPTNLGYQDLWILAEAWGKETAWALKNRDEERAHRHAQSAGHFANLYLIYTGMQYDEQGNYPKGFY